MDGFPNFKNAKASAGGKKSGERAAVNFNLINPVDLASKWAPQREWIVEDWLPVGCVTANYGDGGTGKTLLAQQLMTAAAVEDGIWCGRQVMPCRSLGLFCEDDEDELHRRQEAICAGYGASAGMDKLGKMRWVSGVGQDNALMAFDQDGGYTTPLYDMIKTAALAHGAKLIVPRHRRRPVRRKRK